MGKVVEIQDHKRGCGTRKKGGCYLDSEGMPGGTLARLTWALDSCLEVEPQFYVNIPARGVHLFDPVASLVLRDVVAPGFPVDVPGNLQHLLELGRMGLVDHVGEAYYTPWSFAQELAKLGPSRRVPRDVARQIAPRVPVIILFSGRLPLFHDFEAACAFIAEQELAPDPAGLVYGATWENPQWKFRVREHFGGPYIERYDGGDHYMTRVLACHDRLRPAEREQMFPLQAELPFCLSVITRATYVLADDEDELPPDLQGTGIQAGRLIEPRGQDREDEERA